jgi:hypothetical protein
MSNSILTFPTILRIRRNHALEHATLQILSKKNPHLMLAGYSDPGGFWVVGQVPTQDLQLAVDEALARLRNGERELAIHPNCGTNFAVSGLFAGGAAWLAMLGADDARKKLDRLPTVVMLVTLMLIVTRPFGPLLQAAVTTEASVGPMQVVGINCYERQNVSTHRVMTRQ